MLRLALIVVCATLVTVPATVHSEGEVETVDGYRRGKKVKVKVASIGYEWADLPTADAFLAMRDAALADGIDLYVYSGFRTYEQQQWLYDAYKAGYGNKAARPGHSNHQLGKALDIYLGVEGTYAWLVANAKKFGFKRTVRGEPWHWEFVKKPKKKSRKRR
jgi:D-alanyl-D-alanine carboxypeptidase